MYVLHADAGTSWNELFFGCSLLQKWNKNWAGFINRLHVLIVAQKSLSRSKAAESPEVAEHSLLSGGFTIRAVVLVVVGTLAWGKTLACLARWCRFKVDQYNCEDTVVLVIYLRWLQITSFTKTAIYLRHEILLWKRRSFLRKLSFHYFHRWQSLLVWKIPYSGIDNELRTVDPEETN